MCVFCVLCVHAYTCTCIVYVAQKHTHMRRHMWEHTQVQCGQIGVLFYHSSPKSHFPSIHSLWREGFLPAVLPEVKVIRPGMSSGLLGLHFLLFSPSPPFMSPNCLSKSKNTPSPQVTSGIFLYFVLLTFSLTPFFHYIKH